MNSKFSVSHSGKLWQNMAAHLTESRKERTLDSRVSFPYLCVGCRDQTRGLLSKQHYLLSHLVSPSLNH